MILHTLYKIKHMKIEQMESAKAIMGKITSLKYQRDKEFDLSKVFMSDRNRGFLRDFEYDPAPEFKSLYEQLTEDLADLHEKYCRKINKEITKLEKEFEKL